MRRRPIRTLAAALIVGTVLAGARSAGAGQRQRVTPELEQAVSRGLNYLARTQTPQGCWPDTYGSVSGVVGLAMMTFLAHGERPDEGRYGKVIRRAVDYIVKNQQANGLLSAQNRSPMYSHGFATLALGEVYGMIDDRGGGPPPNTAPGLLVRCHPARGGWLYRVGHPRPHTTVTGCQMMALRAAANAGIEVPHATIKRGVAYYRKCFCPGGGFGYTGPSSPGNALSGIGLLILSLSGEYRSKEAKATADLLFRGGGRAGMAGHFYMSYYCSQAMYQAGGKYWEHWNTRYTPGIIEMQRPDGSWDGGGGRGGGPTCCTAMALLSLEINYNFLPIYQR